MEKKKIEQCIETQHLRAKQKMIVEIGLIRFRIGVQESRIEEWLPGKIPVLALTDLRVFIELEGIVQKRNTNPA